MRVYRAMGDRKNADIHDAAYRKYKDDETIRARRRATSGSRNPWANRESLPIHVHAEAEPPPAAPAPWVSAMGPKGYETDRGYLTRAHPPVPSEAGQWSYATASTDPPSGSPRAPSSP